MTDQPDTLPSGDGAAAESAEAYCPACGQSFPADHQRCPNDGARLVRLAGQVDPLIGRVFEQRYEVRSRLGEGGMGTVYRGWQVSVDREVAIKVIDPRLSSNRSVVKRFLREARLSSRLGQPSIVNVYDFGQTEDGILYIVMELLRGRTLAAELDAHRALGLERTLRITVQLCDALDAAHKLGIVHRDLKPGNIILLDDPPGRDLVKVLDFGLAKSLDHDAISKVTHSGTLLGTPLYMSPEQIASQPSDARADLYALGCIVHEMLSGASPFVGPTVERVLANHIYELAAPLPPDVPPAIAEVIERMMAKHPADRPQTAAEVREALLGHASAPGGDPRGPRSSSPSAWRSVPPSSPSAPRSVPPSTLSSSPAVAGPRRWWLGLLAALGIAAIAVAIVGMVRRAPSATPAMPAAARDTAPEVPSRTPELGPDARVLPLDARVPVLDSASGAASGAAGDVRPPRDARGPVRRDAGHAGSRPAQRPAVPAAVLDAGAELEFYRADAR